MKKALLGTFVTLLVIAALVSCDGVIGGFGGEKVEYTPDGRKLVEIKIPTGDPAGGRSISGTLNESEVNYVEALFVDPVVSTAFYKASGYKGTTLTVSLPGGTYDDTNSVMLVGKRSGSDNILLGVGSVSDGGTVSGAGTMEFTVTYLETNLKAGAASSFKIDGTTGAPAVNTGNGGAFNGKLHLGEIFSAGDCFQVPTGTVGIGASLTFAGFADTGANGFGDTGGNIFVNGTPTVTFTQFLVTSPAITVLPADITPKDGDPIGTDGVIGFEFTTTAVGTYMVTFNIPVVGFDALSGGITWEIRGGTKPGQPDFDGEEEDGVPLTVVSAPASIKFPIEIEF